MQWDCTEVLQTELRKTLSNICHSIKISIAKHDQDRKVTGEI